MDSSDIPFTLVQQLKSRPPSVSFRWSRLRTIYLRAPDGRIWPIIYHERREVKVLTSGWQFLKSEYQIMPGDRCRIELEDPLEHIYRLDIIRT